MHDAGGDEAAASDVDAEAGSDPGDVGALDDGEVGDGGDDAAGAPDAPDGLDTAPDGESDQAAETPLPARLPGLEMWLDASGDPCRPGVAFAWPDLSRNGHDAQPSPGHTYQVGFDQLTGHCVVDMTGPDAVMSVDGDFVDFRNGFSVFVVLNPLVSLATNPLFTPAPFTHLLDFGTVLGRRDDSVFLDRRGPYESQAGLYVYSGADSDVGFTTIDVFGDFSWQLIEFLLPEGASGDYVEGGVFRNGKLLGHGSVAVPKVISRRSNFIGGSNVRDANGNEVDGHLQAHLGEIVIFRWEVTDQERTDLESYFLSKWNIPTPAGN